MRGNGTRFIVISFKSTFSDPSNRAELRIENHHIHEQLTLDSLHSGIVSVSPSKPTILIYTEHYLFPTDANFPEQSLKIFRQFSHRKNILIILTIKLQLLK